MTKLARTSRFCAMEALEGRRLLAGVAAVSAEALLDSFATNSNWVGPARNPDTGQLEPSWADWETTAGRLAESGIRYSRTRAPLGTTGDGRGQIERILGTSAVANTRWALTGTRRVNGQIRLDDIPKVVRTAAEELDGVVFGIMGLNEHDNQRDPSVWVPQWKQAQGLLYQEVQDSPISHVQVMAGPITFPNNVDKLGDVSDLVDIGNAHTYPRGSAAQYVLESRVAWPDAPLHSTEFGFTNAVFADIDIAGTERSAAKDVPRVYLQNFDEGVARSYQFQIRDTNGDGNNNGVPDAEDLAFKEGNWGLLDLDGNPKPAFHAVKNLIGVLSKHAGSEYVNDLEQTNVGGGHWVVPELEARPFDLSITGNTAGVRHLLLQQIDGSYDLVLWQDVQDAVPVTPGSNSGPVRDRVNPTKFVNVTFGQTVASAEIYENLDEIGENYEPTGDGAAPKRAIAFPLSVPLQVPDEPIVLHFDPADPQPVNYYQEAEHYQNSRRFGPMAVGYAADDTGYVSRPTAGVTRIGAPRGDILSGVASYDVATPADATADVWLRVRAADDGPVSRNDGLWLDWRGGGDDRRAELWDGELPDGPAGREWGWYKVATKALEAGVGYTFDVGYADDGVQVDKVYFSFDGTRPAGAPAEAAPDPAPAKVVLRGRSGDAAVTAARPSASRLFADRRLDAPRAARQPIEALVRARPARAVLPADADADIFQRRVR